MLKVAVYWMKNSNTPRTATVAFNEGLKRHDVDLVEIEYHNINYPPVEDADLHVVYSMKIRSVLDYCRAHGRDFICIDHGYLGDRHQNFSAGFNGLNGRAEFYNRDMPSDRFERFADMLRPWRDTGTGDYVLLVGQVPNDASHKGLVDIRAWYPNAQAEIERITGLPVRFRPHPMTKPSGPPLRPLQEDLKDAACVVTYNSNTAVEAVMAGIPAVVMDHGAMAWPVSGHGIAAAIDPPRPDRGQWGADLAYAQWHLDEFRAGDAWDHLKQRYV